MKNSNTLVEIQELYQEFISDGTNNHYYVSLRSKNFVSSYDEYYDAAMAIIERFIAKIDDNDNNSKYSNTYYVFKSIQNQILKNKKVYNDLDLDSVLADLRIVRNSMEEYRFEGFDDFNDYLTLLKLNATSSSILNEIQDRLIEAKLTKIEAYCFIEYYALDNNYKDLAQKTGKDYRTVKIIIQTAYKKLQNLRGKLCLYYR